MFLRFRPRKRKQLEQERLLEEQKRKEEEQKVQEAQAQEVVDAAAMQIQQQNYPSVANAQVPQQPMMAQPVQQQVQQPVQQYVQQPVQQQVQQPVQQYVQQPVQQYVQQPVQQYVQQPVQQNVQQPVQGQQIVYVQANTVPVAQYGQAVMQPQYAQQMQQQPVQYQYYQHDKVRQEQIQNRYKRRPTIVAAEKLAKSAQDAEDLKRLLEANTKQFEAAKQKFEQQSCAKKIESDVQKSNQHGQIDQNLGLKLAGQEIEQKKLEVRMVDGRKYLVHKVQASDSLMHLSLKYHTPQRQVMILNNLTNDMIFQRLELLFPYQEIFDDTVKETSPEEQERLLKQERERKVAVFMDFLRAQTELKIGVDQLLHEAEFYMEESDYDIEKAKHMYQDDVHFEQVYEKENEGFTQM